MSKRWMSLVIIVFAFVFITTSLAVAEGSIMPRYSNVINFDADLSLSAGKANAFGVLQARIGYGTSVTVRLQRCDDGTWVNLAVWSDSNSDGLSAVTGDRVIATGHEYRVYATGKVYDTSGNLIETVTKYSAVKSY